MINHVTLVGRLSDEPEAFATKSGQAIARFKMECVGSDKDIPVSLYGDDADILLTANVGDNIGVQGRIKVTYNDVKDTYFTEVTARSGGIYSGERIFPINYVCLVGRVFDIQDEKEEDGEIYAGFTMICEREFRNHKGERENDEIPVAAGGHDANFILSHVRDGNILGVQGRLSVIYDDLHGIYFTEVVARHTTLLDRRTVTVPDKTIGVVTHDCAKESSVRHNFQDY